MPTETADWVGLTLDGRYAITAKLGEGGMGFVYRAKDARLSCDVVVKVPRAAMLEDAGFRQRFRDEVGALVKLAHPHVVKVTDFGQHDCVPFAVMQFLQAGSLEDRRPKDAAGHPKAVAPRSLNEWLLPVAEALDFIHKKGYVHRDVKPANILFDADKNAYISDFGVAKAVAGNRPAGPGITGAGLVVGTPTYMAPELVLGAPFDGKIDQYALAVTVFEVLAGRPPFDGPTPMAVLIKRTTDDPPMLTDARPGTAAGIAAAVAKALSKDPGQRFPNCAAFAKAVLAGLAHAAPTPVAHAPRSTPVAHAPGSSKRETPRGGIKPGTAEDLPVATVVSDNGLAFSRKTPPPGPAAPAGNRTGLIVGLTSGGVLLVALAGVGIWLGTRGGDAMAGGGRPRPVSSTEKKADKPPIAGVPGSPNPIDLRPQPTTVELLAGGPWVPVDIAVERTGTEPVTVELAPPFGVEAKPAAVTVEASEPARFELRAAAAAVPTPGMTARLTVRGTSVRYALPVVLKRLDFQVSLASPGEIGLSAGQEKAVELRIDRSGGYTGALTVAVPASAVLKATTAQVPSDATTATVSIVVLPTARPGGFPVRIMVAGSSGGVSHELPVTVRVAPVAEARSFVGHTGTVHAISLSPDGKLAVSGGADGTVRLWDVATGQQKWKGEGHTGAVLSVAFSADAGHVLSGGADKTVRLWDVATGKERAFDKHHDSAVWLVRFDDAKIAHSVSADKTIHWVVENGKPRQVPDGRKDLIMGQKFKNDIAAGDELKPTTRVPTDSGEFLLSGVGGTIISLFERWSAAKADPRPVKRPAPRPTPAPRPGAQDMAQMRMLMHVPTPVRLLAAAGEGGRVLSVGEDNSVRLWDTAGVGAAARVARAVPGYPWPAEYDVTCAALDAEGRQALLGGPEGTLKLWRLP
jgi:serine/threonine protein kinase